MKNIGWLGFVVLVASCGEIEKVKDDINSWADKGPLQQRHDQCEAEKGTWVAKITVDACVGGKTKLHVQGDPNDGNVASFDQDCLKGEGAEYPFPCTHTDDAGRLYFNDGPSTPNFAQSASEVLGASLNQLNWNGLFWAGARNHDYCYHSGIARNFTKDDCDNQFKADLAYVCTQPQSPDKDWFSVDKCNVEVDGMYQAVHTAGDTAYNAMGTVVDYPAWQAPPPADPNQGFVAALQQLVQAQAPAR